MRSVSETCSKSRRALPVKSQSITLRPLGSSRASHLGQVQKLKRPPSFGPRGTLSKLGFLLNSSIFSRAMAVIRSLLDLHSRARSELVDWSREPLDCSASQSGCALPYLAQRWEKAWPPFRFKLPPKRCH